MAVQRPLMCNNGADLYDPAEFLSLHDLHGLFRAEEGAGQIIADQGFPALEGDFEYILGLGIAGVVHQDIEPAEGFHKNLKETIHVSFGLAASLIGKMFNAKATLHVPWMTVAPLEELGGVIREKFGSESEYYVSRQIFTKKIPPCLKEP